MTQIATGIVTIYGMNKNIGMVSYHQEEGYQKPYSESTGSRIDEEVKSIINKAYVETKELLESKKELIDNLAKTLLEKEVVTLPDLIKVLGERPWPMKEHIREYLEEIQERNKEEQEAAVAAQEAKAKEDDTDKEDDAAEKENDAAEKDDGDKSEDTKDSKK